MMNYRKFRKNAKAISPVISVLLMIAVAVAASLVTYAWVMGYLGFTTNKVGKAIQIQAVSVGGVVSVQNVGDSAVTCLDVYVDGVDQGNFIGGLIDPGETDSVEVTLPVSFASNTPYTIKVTTTDGTFSEITKIFP
jgi:flagellin-like protein